MGWKVTSSRPNVSKIEYLSSTAVKPYHRNGAKSGSVRYGRLVRAPRPLQQAAACNWNYENGHEQIYVTKYYHIKLCFGSVGRMAVTCLLTTWAAKGSIFSGGMLVQTAAVYQIAESIKNTRDNSHDKEDKLKSETNFLLPYRSKEESYDWLRIRLQTYKVQT